MTKRFQLFPACVCERPYTLPVYTAHTRPRRTATHTARRRPGPGRRRGVVGWVRAGRRRRPRARRLSSSRRARARAPPIGICGLWRLARARAVGGARGGRARMGGQDGGAATAGRGRRRRWRRRWWWWWWRRRQSAEPGRGRRGDGRCSSFCNGNTTAPTADSVEGESTCVHLCAAARQLLNTNHQEYQAQCTRSTIQ